MIPFWACENNSNTAPESISEGGRIWQEVGWCASSFGVDQSPPEIDKPVSLINSALPVSVNKSSAFTRPLPCNTAAETALQLPFWCF